MELTANHRVATFATPPERTPKRPLRLYRYPLAAMTPRDLLLLDHLKLKPTDRVLEIGVGSATSVFRLSQFVKELDGVDISAATIRWLEGEVAADAHTAGKVRLFAQ